MVQGRQDFNSSKAGKKALKEGYCGPVRRRYPPFGNLWQARLSGR